MIKLWHDVKCPQSRAVLILLNLLRIEHHVEHVNLASSTEFYPEILEMNPENIVPIINDNGLILVDSHAINAYLADKYAPNDTLYPKEPSQRARVDHMLHVDTGVLYPLYKGDVVKVFNQYMRKMLSGLAVNIVKDINKAYDVLQNFLKHSTYIAGDQPTIADISVYSSLSLLDEFAAPHREDYPHVLDYMKLCEKNIDFLKSISSNGVEEYRKFVKNIKFKRWAKVKKARKEEMARKEAQEAEEIRARKEARAAKEERARKAAQAANETKST